MKQHLLSKIRKLVPPSVRFDLRQAVAWLQELRGRACFWRWELVRLPHRGDEPYNVFYVGRKEQRNVVVALLGIDGEIDANHVSAGMSWQSAYVSELPIPGALRVPSYLSAIVPLGRPLEEILARYDAELRRRLRKQRARYRIRQVLDDEEIDRANREMLQPYATARRGDTAVQLESDVVWKIAQEFGRLDFVYLGDEVVACHLGNALTRAGKRYWSTVRFGYPEAVFSDPKRLRETNSITTYIALEWALDNGFDFYDIGGTLGRPDDGLLQWKRRRGGSVDTMGNHGYFYIRLPRNCAAQFLWDAPLFAVEHCGLTLQLGLPAGPSDEEVIARYREMGFGGLAKVCLRSARPPGRQLMEALRGLFSHEKSPPIIEIIAT